MNESARDLPEDLKLAAWEDTVIVWMDYRQPRNLELAGQQADLIQVLSNWTDRDPADIQSYWPLIREEVVAAQGIFGVRKRMAPPAAPPRSAPSDSEK